MRRTLGGGLAVLAAVLLLPGTAVAAAPGQVAPVYGTGSATAVAGQYLVVFKDSVTAAQDSRLRQAVTGRGGRVQHHYSAALRGFSARLSGAALEHVRADAAVAYVEQDQIVTVVDTQLHPPSWGLDRVDQRVRPLDASYTNPSAASAVTAYVIDTGIRFTHQEFGGRARSGIDTVDNDGDASDCAGHGTHVAGTIGGATYGVAKRVNLVAVRVLNCQGSGTFAGVVAGVDWVTANAVRPAVANMSLGGGASTALDSAVRNSINSGITYAIAAGNDFGADACNTSPARVLEAVTVGATDISDNRASFSNVGTCLDLFGPGVNITSAWFTGDTATNTISGTSMATPHVAGAAAMVLAANPGLTPGAVRDTLVNTATAGVVVNPGAGSPNRLLYVGPPNPIDNPRTFVAQQYRDFLGREPDGGGWDFWTGPFVACGSDAGCVDAARVNVSLAFWYSGEFLATRPGLRNPPGTSPDFVNAEFVRQEYLVYLRREPDPGGLAFWLGQLNQQNDYFHNVKAFLLSTEYRARFGPA